MQIMTIAAMEPTESNPGKYFRNTLQQRLQKVSTFIVWKDVLKEKETMCHEETLMWVLFELKLGWNVSFNRNPNTRLRSDIHTT